VTESRSREQPSRTSDRKTRHAERERRDHQETDPPTEEDLQARDASEMPSEPQNPVNPNPETAS
jgi:hypothetical protein